MCVCVCLYLYVYMFMCVCACVCVRMCVYFIRIYKYLNKIQKLKTESLVTLKTFKTYFFLINSQFSTFYLLFKI